MLSFRCGGFRRFFSSSLTSTPNTSTTNNAMKRMVLGCGSNVVDKFFKVRALPRPGEKGYFQSPTRIVEGSVVGGVTVNHLAWAKMLGVPTGLLALQGNDSSGKLIREKLQQLNMSTKYIDVSDNYTTAESLIFLQEDGERSIIMASGATSLINKEIGQNLSKNFLLANCKHSIFSTEISQVPLSGVCVMLEEANKHNNITVLDVDVVPSVAIDQAKLGNKQELLQCVQLAHILKPSHIAACELLEWLTGKKIEEKDIEDYSKLTSELLKHTNAKMVALTSGSQGCVIAVRNNNNNDSSSSSSSPVIVKVAPHSIESVLDATGAGDAFLGGLIAGLYPVISQGRCVTSLTPSELTRLGKLANAAGAACCRVLGGLPEPASFDLVAKFEPYATQLLNQSQGTSSPSSTISANNNAPATSCTSANREGVQTSVKSDAATAAHVAATISAQQVTAVASAILDAVNAKSLVLISGAGKSGLVGQRLAASLRSLSVPSQFIAATEWAHGDLGVVGTSPVVIFLSHSGSTSECVEARKLLHARCKPKIVSIVGRKNSELTKDALSVDYSLPAGAFDPFGVPTSSIVAQEMIANALLREFIALQQQRSVDVAAIFRDNHPGGTIGASHRSN